MKLIEPSFEILKPFDCVDPIESAKRAIERAGRTSYKSEDKITERSWISFFEMLKEKKHLSVFEFGELFLRIPIGSPAYDNEYLQKIDIKKFFNNNIYSKCHTVNETTKDLSEQEVVYISTNFRVIEENNGILNWKWLSQYVCHPTDNHSQKISVKFICSRAISHELVRHRTFSMIQESQRYVNYSKDKFGSEITYIMPEYGHNCSRFIESLERAEKDYFYLLGLGWKPQEAREVLPNATKTEIILSGFKEDWEHFFKLRTADNTHPEMRKLTIPLQIEINNDRNDNKEYKTSNN